MGTYCSKLFEREASQAKTTNTTATATTSQTASSMGQAPLESNGHTTSGISVSSAKQVLGTNFKDKYTYEKANELGRGNFATVLLGKSLHTGHQVAVKRIRDSDLTAEDRAALVEEIRVLKSLDHPNIIKFYDYFPERPFHLIVTEYVAGGELFDRITEKEFYMEDDAVKIVRTIAKALEYLHSKDVVHRDLKPENLLLAVNDRGEVVDEDIKLADFGFAKIGNDSLQTACGTPGYVAPEILKGEKYGAEVDLWSFGVIIYILLCGYPPFIEDEETGQKGLFDKIKHGAYSFTPEQYWREVGESPRDLITKLLVVDPKRRLSVSGVLTHPWLTSSQTEISQTAPVQGNRKELKFAKEKLKEFQANKKFKRAAHAVIALNRIKSGGAKHIIEGKDNIDGAGATVTATEPVK